MEQESNFQGNHIEIKGTYMNKGKGYEYIGITLENRKQQKSKKSTGKLQIG